MKKTSIVFDFDGTLADSITIGFRLANTIIEKLGVIQLTEEEFTELRNKPYYEIIKKYNIPLWQVPKLLLKLRNKMAENIDQVHPYEGIPELLRSLSENGYNLFILTSNDAKLVQTFLDNHAITVFQNIYSEKNIFGKARAITRFLKKEKLSKDEILYVGDEVRDIEACKKAGVEIVSVTYGFNGESILREHNPDYIVHTPSELKKIVGLS